MILSVAAGFFCLTLIFIVKFILKIGGKIATLSPYRYLCHKNYDGMTKRILVVDDEETLCEALKFNLEAEGYEVDTAHSAEEALCMDLPSYNLFLLDVMMGEISGTQLASILKSNPSTASIPIIFCTAMADENDMVNGLYLGADDYITKPYSLKNVLARIHSVLRRADSHPAPRPKSEAISFKGLTIIPAQKLCYVDGKEVKLPRKEFEILLKLITHPGQVFSRDELLHEIWPEEVIVLHRVVDVNITRIRQKIAPYGKHIITRSGYGYGFME